jgi:dipeptidyl-peptidase-3
MFRPLMISLCLVASMSSMAATFEPLTVPETIRITSSEPRKGVWSSLSSREQKLATHLLAAAKAGKFILLHQNHRHGLLIKNVLESSLSQNNIASTKSLLGDSFNEYVNYALKFEDQVGPYATANRKYVLKKVSADKMLNVFKRHATRADLVAINEAVRVMTDVTFEVIQRPEDSEGEDLENSGTNIYEHGITHLEVSAALAKGLKSDVNCRIVRGGPAGLKCQVQALNNPELPAEVRAPMTKVVAELTQAIQFSSSEHQARQIGYLISYLTTGNVEDFRQMNVEWVKDGTNSKVDFMMGYVEVYADYLTQVGSWESYVQIVDPKTTALSKNLAKHAQDFENQMPYGQYKKTFPEGYSPPAMMVYYFQEISGFRSGGYNLPNYDDIRRDVGAKNVIRLDLPGLDVDPNTLRDRRQVYETYSPSEVVNDVVNMWTKGRQTLVLLHEIIGHGSGTYNTTKYGPKEDPVSSLGALGSSMEEQRADLAALTFAADPIMTEIGMFADQTEATRSRNAMYDAYNANFLRDLSKQKSLSEAHHRGHWLLLNTLLEHGAIVKASRDGSMMTDENLVLKVVDYDKYNEVCKELLGALQHIKAERLEQDLKDLYLKYAPLSAITEPWLQNVIKRGATLVINSGTYEQPWEIKGGDVQVYGALSPEGISGFLNK